MAGRKAEPNWNSQISRQIRKQFLDAVALVRMLFAIWHLSKENSANPLQAPCHSQLSQHAVDLVGPHPRVFEK
jgi:hypothetical protein